MLSYKLHENKIRSAVFSPDEMHLLTASNDNTVVMTDLSTGNHEVIGTHDNWINEALFSPDGEYIITASDDSTAKIFETHTKKLLHDLVGHSASVHSASFSPDSKLAITASMDRTVRL